MITVRPALAGEVDAVRSLAIAAYQPYVSRIGREPAPMVADYGAEIRAGHVRVADDGRRIVGFVVMHRLSNHLLIENVAVHPDARGRGIGAQLLMHAEAYALASGLREVRLYTNEAMTENLAYYPRRGYAETHRATEDGYHRVFYAKKL